MIDARGRSAPDVGWRMTAVLAALLAFALIVSLIGWQAGRRRAVLPLLQADFAGVAWTDLPASSVPVPEVPELGDSTMINDALTDLARLSSGQATVAGMNRPWRKVWPRDSAFVAVAFARTGHQDEAIEQIDFLQQVQGSDGTFHARYLPDTGLPPDDRGIQLDGTGWAMWATRHVAQELPNPDRQQFLDDHGQLIDRSTRKLLAVAAEPELPISPDYWEVAERRPTLATAAVLAAGLDAAAQLAVLRGQGSEAATLDQAADDFRSKIISSFGTDGFPRRLGGSADSVDLGLAFLMPPFAAPDDPFAAPDDVVAAAWQDAPAQMARPAGGLAPGGSWRKDGISWTNATATAAMVDAAAGNRDRAIRWLRWIDAHRTPAGSIPEKVLWDGRPAAVAPLAWSAAAVVIAATELDRTS